MRTKLAVLVLVLFAVMLFAPSAPAQQTFFYVARAVDANGVESANSNEASASINQTLPLPKLTVVLTWTASTSTVAGYNIYRSKVTGTGYVKINAALVTALTYTDTFLPPAPPTGLSGT
jgi:hypothetical protein